MRKLTTELLLILKRFKEFSTDPNSSPAYAGFLRVFKEKILTSIENSFGKDGNDYQIFCANFNLEFLNDINLPGYFEYCKNRLEEIERKLSIEAKNIIFDYCNVILENGSFITNTIDDNNLLQIYIGNLLIEIFLTWKKNPYKYCGEIIRMNKLTKEWYNFEIDDLNDNGKNFIHYYEKFLKSYMELQDNVIAYLEKLYFENRKLESYEYELANYIEKNVKRDMERDMEKSIDNLNGMKNVGRRNRRKREPSGIAKPTNLSREMCQFLGINEDIRLSRIDVTKRIIDYIRKYDLCNPNNKKEIIPDEKLQALLKVPKKETLTYFNLQKYLRNHCLG